MTSSHLRTSGLKSNRQLSALLQVVVHRTSPPTFSKTSTVRRSSSSTSIRWLCSRSNRMNFSSRSAVVCHPQVATTQALHHLKKMRPFEATRRLLSTVQIAIPHLRVCQIRNKRKSQRTQFAKRFSPLWR